MVDSELEGGGCDSPGVLGASGFAPELVLFQLNRGFPKRVVVARWRIEYSAVGEGGAVEGDACGINLEGVFSADVT